MILSAFCERPYAVSLRKGLPMRKRPSAFGWSILLHRSVFVALFDLLLLATTGAAAQGADLEGGTPNTTCKMTTKFPDGSPYSTSCVMTILAAGQNSFAPKGSVQFVDTRQQKQTFTLSFFPPKQIKPNVPYTLSTDSLESFLSGTVQQTSAHELCRMNKKFSSTGTVTFTSVGANSADYHGSVQLYPACYLNLGTPQETLVPSGKTGGTVMVVF
jgi:hypothetical protein